MKAENINPFIQSVTEVFENMLDCQVKMGNPGIAQEEAKGPPDIIGVIGLSGTAQGAVAIKFPIKTALMVIGKMVGAEFRSVDSSIVDGVGEIVNIIAGNAKSKFPGHSITLSLPTVVRGTICSMSNLKNAVFMTVPFETELGGFSILVTLKPVVVPEKEAANARVSS